MKYNKIFIFVSIFIFLLSSCWNTQQTETVTSDTTAVKENINTDDINNNSKDVMKTETSSGNNNLANNNKQMKKEMVSKWDNISVSYTGTLEDGTVFDATSKHWGKALEFTAWAWQMIKGFDAWVIWMKLGETKKIEMEAKDAYWEYNPEKKQVVKKTELESFKNAWYKLEKWEKLPTQMWELTILETTDDTITLDLNHPLAWKKLIFEVKIEDIK